MTLHHSDFHVSAFTNERGKAASLEAFRHSLKYSASIAALTCRVGLMAAPGSGACAVPLLSTDVRTRSALSKEKFLEVKMEEFPAFFALCSLSFKSYF